ncbi:MAG: glycosyltransferase [Acidimicrobiia bacterium]
MGRVSGVDLPVTAPFFASEGSMPPPEKVWKRFWIRTVTLATLVASVTYLLWRALYTLSWDTFWLGVPLFGFEVLSVVGLALFAHSLWDLDGNTPPAPGSGATFSGSVAVLIPTFNEPLEVLLPTIAAATSLEPAHETWVLDDGKRGWVKRLAQDLGANYLTRDSNEHAKAGNLNHALSVVDADVVAVFDADHVASPNFLLNTLNYFERDPKVALVQTPQDFYNRKSFEYWDSSGASYGEQVLFYRGIQPGRNRWGAGFWCGTNALVRTEALQEIGGVATDSVTEDIHTTIRLHKAGWRSVYHNEVLAHGLAASGADQYLLQRYRWGSGAMQVLRAENPLFQKGLTFHQKVAYLTTLSAWWESWRLLGYLLIPALVLISGVSPINANIIDFMVWFVPVFLMQRLTLRLLSRGFGSGLRAVVFDVIRMPAGLTATLNLFRSRPLRFEVTPKGASGRSRVRQNPPGLLWLLFGGGIVALAWGVATLAGWLPQSYYDRWVVVAALFWHVFNLGLIGTAIARVRSLQFGSERRNSVRFGVGYQGVLANNTNVAVVDVSLTGAKAYMPVMGLPPTAVKETLGPERPAHTTIVNSTVADAPINTGDTVLVPTTSSNVPDVTSDSVLKVGDITCLELPQLGIVLDTVVRNKYVTDGKEIVGLEFVENQTHQIAALSLNLFQNRFDNPDGNTETQLKTPTFTS